MKPKPNEHPCDFDNTVTFSFREQPSAPNSTPPMLEGLRRSVSHRRIRRRVIRTGSTMAALALFTWTALMIRKDDASVTNFEAPLLVTTDNKEHSGKELVTIETPLEEFESPIRVLARVMQPEPIFHVDPETQQTWQVGWIEAEHTVPMDLRHFSPSQKARFQNVLFQNIDSPSL